MAVEEKNVPMDGLPLIGGETFFSLDCIRRSPQRVVVLAGRGLPLGWRALQPGLLRPLLVAHALQLLPELRLRPGLQFGQRELEQQLESQQRSQCAGGARLSALTLKNVSVPFLYDYETEPRTIIV